MLSPFYSQCYVSNLPNIIGKKVMELDLKPQVGSRTHTSAVEITRLHPVSIGLSFQSGLFSVISLSMDMGSCGVAISS